MKRNYINYTTRIDQMPLYNRSHVQKKHKNEEDIALSTHKKQVFLEKEVRAEDTLQSVSLEFNVPVAELKRINNIHKDNEIFARKIIKVPSNSLSILLEKDYFSEKRSTPEKPAVPPSEKVDVIVESVNNSCTVAKSSTHSTVEDKYSVTTTEIQESSALLNTTIEPKTTDMSCSGADWGISWHALLCITLILGLGGPFIYVFWLFWGRKGKTTGS